MKRKIIVHSSLLTIFLLISIACAVHYLQKESEGGTNNVKDETMYSPSEEFKINDLTNPIEGSRQSTSYTSSEPIFTNLLEPNTTVGDVGSVSFNNVKADVTEGVISAPPPAEARKNDNLPSSRLSETYQKELASIFSKSKDGAYNSHTDGGGNIGGLNPSPSRSLDNSIFPEETSPISVAYSPEFEPIIATSEGTIDEPDSLSSDDHNSAPVPEPTTILLFGTGLASMLARKRKNMLRKRSEHNPSNRI